MVQTRAGRPVNVPANVLVRAQSWSDRLLDATVVFLATWTVVYHVCLVLRLSTTWAVGLELVALVGAAVLVRRRAGDLGPLGPPAPAEAAVSEAPTGPPEPARLRMLARVTVASALVAAVSRAFDAPWALLWLPWLVAAATGSLWAWLSLARLGGPAGADTAGDDTAGDDTNGDDSWTTLGVLVWAVALAVLAMWTLRPNPDDLFYVNLSQWVAAHGEFPLKDTLFSELAHPMANWPPVASYDGLVGVVARFAGAHAATVEYVVVPPLATFLAVLALWRLLRAWRVRHLFWVLSAALVFLLLDGTGAYATPGNLFLTRLWQGKIILLCVVVPVLLVHALRYVERPARARLLPLLLGGTAAVGLTTTGIFLVPILAVAAMAPLAVRDLRRAATGFLALAIYPLGAGVVTLALGGRSADDFGERRLYRFDASWIGHQLLLTALVGFVVVLAMLLGALLVPHPAARLTSGLTVLFTGYVFVPGAMHAAYGLSGLGPTLWRISWAACIAALVGVLVVHGFGPLVGRVLERTGRVDPRRWSVPVAVLLTAALLGAFGHPIWASNTGTSFRTPFHWQRSASSRGVTAQILDAAGPGTLVLAPESLSITIAVTTTDVKTVAPRDYYMAYLENTPSFHYPERLTLVHYVNHLTPRDVPGIAHDLRVVGVDVACTRRQDHHRYAVIRAAGFRPLLTSTYYRCLTRT